MNLLFSFFLGLIYHLSKLYAYISLLNAHILLPYNLIACPCTKDTHERADKVKEAIGEVGEGGYAEDGGLGHAAGVPGDEYGGYRDGIFGRAAQETALVAIAAVDVLEHVAREDDRDVLVGRGDVEEEARGYGGGNHAGAIVGEAGEQSGDAFNHTACCHGATKAHSTDDEPNGVHHT